MSARAVQRRHVHRRCRSGQAVLEMALVLPIMLALVALFAAIVMQAQAVVRLQSALSLGTESMFAADVGDYRGGCTDTALSFFGTVYGSSLAPVDLTPCQAASPSGFTVVPVTQPRFEHVQGLTCTNVGYLTGKHDAPVTCTAQVSLDYSQSPVGWLVFWSPSITVTNTAVPPAARQCAPGASCT